MSKRTQKDAGEERVTAKTKPMMNLVSRYRVRVPNVLASTTSESLGKIKSESENVPLIPFLVQQTSTERPVLGTSSSSYSEWNIDDKLSSQEWKSGGMSNTSTERPENDKFVIDDVDSDTATESKPFAEVTVILAQGELSSAKDVGPLFKRCNARHRQTFYDLGIENVFDIGSIWIHEKELLRKFTFHQKYKRSHHETDVRHIWEITNRTIRRDIWSEHN